jgi:hypothetical protein
MVERAMFRLAPFRTASHLLWLAVGAEDSAEEKGDYQSNLLKIIRRESPQQSTEKTSRMRRELDAK